MMDIASAAVAAKILSDGVGALDKIYRAYADFANKRAQNPNGDIPPDFSYQDAPEEDGFVARSRQTGQIYQKVTYAELAAMLTDEDKDHISSLTRAMKIYQVKWQSVYEQRAIASTGLETANIDAQLDHIAKQLSDPLIKILDFVEKMGLQLDDHYHVARQIAGAYVEQS